MSFANKLNFCILLAEFAKFVFVYLFSQLFAVKVTRLVTLLLVLSHQLSFVYNF